jgi:hypothetical protein
MTIQQFTKVCTGKCGQEKPLSDFSTENRKGKIVHLGRCKVCVAEYQKEYQAKNQEKIKLQKQDYYQDNREETLIIRKEHYQANREEKLAYQKQYYQDNNEEVKAYKKDWAELNKEERAAYQKQYYQDNKDWLQPKNKIYYEDNKEVILAQNKTYAKLNREARRAYQNEWERNKRATDPAFKLRKIVSRSICLVLKINGSSKAGRSVLLHLPYTFDELKAHIEFLFEPWMTWENWGLYNPKTWKDDDPTTWTWQLDHIIPHSTFHYTTMDCQEFRDCWALSNLRPLSAKQNLLDGSSKIRHPKRPSK